VNRIALFAVTSATALNLTLVWYMAVSRYPRLQELGWAERAHHLVRYTRTLLTGLVVALDYKTLALYQYGTPQYAQARSRIHKRTANRLLRLCRANAGVYIKAGQHLASMNHILPKEYTETLAVLQDQAPARPFSVIEQTFFEQLGAPLDHFFSFVEEKPIAAASLAQVHRGWLSDGTQVAIKVQYPDFERLSWGDLFSIEVVAGMIAWSFPEFNFGWVVGEFEKHLAMEMDFVSEANNAERLAHNFAHNPRIYVPKIYWDMTRRKVLCMEFIHGAKITDVPKLEQMNISKREVAQLLHELFCEQIFIHGFIHSDPHPGNILVRHLPSSPAHPQLVLLDHGLYRTLDEPFRLDYCHLWKAIFTGDKKAVEKYARRMGAGEHHEMFSIILTFRPLVKDGGGDMMKMVKDNEMNVEQVRLIRAQMRERDFHAVFSDLLENIDRRLLLVLRTNNLIRSIIKDLEEGGSVDRFLVMARYAIRGLYHGQEVSLFRRTRGLVEQARFEIRLQFLALAIHFYQWCAGIVSWLYSFPSSPAPVIE
jgi:aarF domain-containing kinase